MVEDHRAAFCAGLKASRERRGVSLDEIAASTKISRALLKGLEENNLSRWPQGLYRRSYLRDYLRALDLPQEPFLAEFQRLFPGDESPGRLFLAEDRPMNGASVLRDETRGLSITLDNDKSQRADEARKRLTAAAIDAAAVLTLSIGAAWGLGADFWVTSTLVALSYYTAGTIMLGRTAGWRALEDRRWRRRPAKTGIRALLRRKRPVGEARDTLFAQLREIKGLSDQPEPALSRGGIFGVLVAAVVPFFRTLFLR